MSPVARLKPIPETVDEMEGAAEDRFQEGQKLVQDGFYHAGIYLLGYSAEIWLKTAFCRVDPTLVLTDTVDSHVGLARFRWQRMFGGKPPSGHDVLFLSLSLEAERQRAGKPSLGIVSAILSQLFNASVSVIYDHWFVEMRYRRQDATVLEAQKMFQSVEWLHDNYLFLWS